MRVNARPISATAALRQLSPRQISGLTSGSNMFAPLTNGRDLSPSPSVCSDSDFRPRAPSLKRKSDESQRPSFAEMAGSGSGSGASTVIPSVSAIDIEKATLDITKVKSICSKVNDDLSKVEIPPEIACIFNLLCEAVGLVSGVQETVLSAVSRQNSSQQSVSQQAPTNNSEWVTIGTLSKRLRTGTSQKLLPQGNINSEAWQPAKPTIQVTDQGQTDPTVTRFKEAIKEAERSTLVFNLDMGKVPIMNHDTMNKRATLALTTMAARKEKKSTSIPSEESVMAIDDLLSVTEGMEFFGAATKSYSHPNDPNSGLYCTVPVKYVFKDKDDRVRAETTLRDRCDVRCTTPYPTMVRECIKQIVSKVKADRPDRLVRVNVDTGSLSFKIATKCKGNKDERMPWEPYHYLVPIPPEAMDTTKRRVPDGFKITWPNSPSPRKNPQHEVMEVTVEPEKSPEGQS
jgi:hypothetical protein